MLLKDVKVIRPKDTKIQKEKKTGINYVYKVVSSSYNRDKKYSIDKRKIIGKMLDDTYMVPNSNFEKYYPELLLTERPISSFSDTVHVGFMVLMNRMLRDSLIGVHLEEIFPSRYELLQDIISFMIKEESCAYEYLEYFENEVITFTGSKYSDSTVSRVLKEEITPTLIDYFLDEWNKTNKDIEEVYINYDSTNIATRTYFSGLSEFGYSKDDEDLPQVNISMAVAKKDNRPLTYSLYPGSIHDSSEIKQNIKAFNKYNYKNIGFIFDRAYYSKPLIRYLNDNKYSYIFMLKENYDFVKEVLAKKEEVLKAQIDCYISEYSLSGIVEEISYEISRKEKIVNYLYIYYNDIKASGDKINLLNLLSRLDEELEDKYNNAKTATKEEFIKYEPYYDLAFDGFGHLLHYKKSEKKIRAKLKDNGFFAILASKKVSPLEMLRTYKERDSIEKLFRALKSSLAFDHASVHSKEALESKVFLTFVATIIRNEIFQKSKKLPLNDFKNYTVPIIIKELHNIEATRSITGEYKRRYSLTKKQRKILNLYGISEKNIDDYIEEFNTKLSLKKQA